MESCTFRSWDATLRDTFFVVEIIVWSCAVLATLVLLISRNPPAQQVRCFESKNVRKVLHGDWFEIAGIYTFADQSIRSTLSRDSSHCNVSVQITNTGNELLDVSLIAANSVEAGKSHQGLFSRILVASPDSLRFHVPLLSGRLLLHVPMLILHVNPTHDLMVWGSPTDKSVVYVFSKSPRPTREKMIPVLGFLVRAGYSLKKLQAVVQTIQGTSSLVLPTVRRFRILSTAETLLRDCQLAEDFQQPTGVSSAQSDSTHYNHSDVNTQHYVADPGWSQSFTLVSPNILRKKVHPDVEAYTHSRFFEGCIRGDQRFVSDFVEREILWTVARHPECLWTGLHFAAYNAYPELVAYLAGITSNPFARSNLDETPLMVAVMGMIRHAEERMRWNDKSTCVFDLQEGDDFYSHRPHSLERYDETIQILLKFDSSLPRHRNRQGEDPLQYLRSAISAMEPSLKVHPRIATQVLGHFTRVQRRLTLASYANFQPVKLDTDLKRAAGMLLWVFVRTCTGLIHYFLKFVDALGLAIVLVCVGFFYWCIFQTAGYLLILARIWVPLGARQRAAQTFSGDCALLVILTVDSPVVTKFAQLLSGRVDLIPQAVADRLAFLQSRAPPMSPQEVEAALCRCYGEDRSHLFASFDMRPLAVGTVAQVHRAHLASSGEPVAVKIVKRGMRKGLDRYLFLLRMLSRLGVFGRSKVARLRVEHVTMMFRQQTDLNLEAASMQAMQREAQRHRVRREDRCHVPDFPQAYSLFTMENILVMDLIDDCVSLQDFLAKPSVPVKVMLARMGRIFYRSVMMDGLLHCDMHPGNIMVRPEDGRIVLLDFGLVGELTESERVALVAFHLASVSNEFVFAAEIFVENFVADVDGRLSDEDVRIRCLVSLGPVFGAHFGEFGGWDFVGFSVDLERVLKEFDVGVTSAWSILQMGIMHFRSTLALLQPKGAFRGVLKQLLHSEHSMLLDALIGTKYHSKLEVPVRQKFGWGLLFKSDRKLRAEQVYS